MNTTPISAETRDIVEHLDNGLGELRLLVRHRAGQGPSVIYIHGATFPSALSVGYRFAGRSWIDDLAARGFDVWAFDFEGFGGSDRPEIFDRDAQSAPPFGRTAAATDQLARVVEHVVSRSGRARVALLAHSWGGFVAGRYASRRPDRIDKIVFFAPFARRDMAGLPTPDSLGAWRLLTIAAQHERFIEDVPPDHPPVLIEPELAQWGPAYLATDPNSTTYGPVPSVKIPTGPQADIIAAWSSGFPYDPAAITAPILIVRGAWDSLTTDADAAYLLERFSSQDKRDVKVPKGTHLMHLEHSREGLFTAAGEFLAE